MTTKKLPAEPLAAGEAAAIPARPGFTDAVGGPRPRVTFEVHRGGSVTLEPPAAETPENTDDAD